MALREMHLFAGAGGGILGGILCGHVPVCAVELEEYPRSILLQRQRDGILPWFPIWDDVRTFDGKPWRGHVDIICGGFPCQDISSAGKHAGIDGERSGLWSEFARIIGEVGPSYAFVENSPMLVNRGLGRVLGALASMGYNAEWGVLGARHVGADHHRDRIWICAHSNRIRLQGRVRERCEIQKAGGEDQFKRLVQFLLQRGVSSGSRGRIADGVANRMDRLKAVGNGQVPAVAALAWTKLHNQGD